MNLIIFLLLLVFSLVYSALIGCSIEFRNGKKPWLRKIQDNILSYICIALHKIGFTSISLTLLNLFFGLLSVYFLLNRKFFYFLLFLFLSFLSDSLDGLIARLTKTTSKFWGTIDFVIDSFIKAMVLFSFWILYKIPILLYGFIALVISLILFSIKIDETKPRGLLKSFINPLYFFNPIIIFFTIFFPVESLTAISICLFINLLSLIFIILKK